MDTFYRIISLLGGLALFLYGMRLMGDGLKGSSGGTMRSVLEKVTDRPIKGFLLGVLVTCMIQSSTATIVLTVGLVGAGFLTFRQSTGIVLGANVGTAITAQIIRLMDVQAGTGSILFFFKSDNLAPLALVIGMVLIMFVKSKTSDTLGTICVGFGILFVGLMNMSAAVSSVSGALSRLLVSFEGNPLLGFLSGALVTGIIQSSSAVIGILQSVASSVGIRFCAVFAVIIGVNIGDCLTTYLVCRIGAKPEQTRTVLVHVIFNVCAAVLLFTVVGVLRLTGVLNDAIWEMTLRSGGVANVHGLFRLIPAIVLLPFTGKMGDLAKRLAPDREVQEAPEETYLRELDPRLTGNPYLALTEAKNLIGHMGEVARENFSTVTQQLRGFDLQKQEWLREREHLLDRMTDEVNKYIVSIPSALMHEPDRQQQSFLIKAMTSYERIGDLAVNIMNNLSGLHASGKTFSATAVDELELAHTAVGDVLELSLKAFANADDEVARRIEPLEEVIDELLETLKERHVERMTEGKCDIYAGIEYQNICLHLERISDQCSDLGLAILTLANEEISGREHAYIHDLHQSEDPDYQTRFHSGYMKYFHMLDTIDGGK